MTTPSIILTLVPAFDVLAKCLAQTSENYQRLLGQPESYSLCTEAGRSMRQLSERYAQVLITALTIQAGSDEDAENWNDDNESPFDEDFGD